jgi:hypothetical protein
MHLWRAADPYVAMIISTGRLILCLTAIGELRGAADGEWLDLDGLRLREERHTDRGATTPCRRPSAALRDQRKSERRP